MDLFEYILILTSVIYALAVTQLLAGVSRMAQSPSAISGYLPQKIWVFNLFLLVFTIWWTNWEFRVVEWTFPHYAYLLIAPTLLFLVCSLLIPVRFERGEASMEVHFNRIKRPFFATYFLSVVAVAVDGNLLSNESIWHSGRYGQMTLLAASIWGYCSSSRKGQIAVAVITLGALIATTVVRFWIPR